MGFTVYDLKPRFQALLRPMVRSLHGAGITANQVTVATALASMAVGGAFELSFTDPVVQPYHRAILFFYPGFLFVRMALNAFDGMLAREFHQQSAIGAFLNEVGDVVSDVVLYLPFLRVDGVAPYFLGLTIFLAAIGEFCGVISQTVGGSRRYDGPMGKSDRAFAFGVFALVLAFNPTPVVASIFSGLILPLSMATVFNRVRNALKEVRRR